MERSPRASRAEDSGSATADAPPATPPAGPPSAADLAERIERVADAVARRERERALRRLDEPTPAQREVIATLSAALATRLVGPAVATLDHPETAESLVVDAATLFADDDPTEEP